MSEAEILSNAQPNFLTFLNAQKNGDIVLELGRATRDLLQDIMEHHNWVSGTVSGEVNIKIKITREDAIYKVDTTYDIKRPQPPPARTIMWMGMDGNLKTQDPRQLTMTFARQSPQTNE
jgi:hypothetical protein